MPTEQTEQDLRNGVLASLILSYSDNASTPEAKNDAVKDATKELDTYNRAIEDRIRAEVLDEVEQKTQKLTIIPEVLPHHSPYISGVNETVKEFKSILASLREEGKS